MKTLQREFLPYIAPVVAVWLVVFGYQQYARAAAISGHTLCKQQYALCTSAKCVPMPGDPTKAICHCVVEDGANMATVPCDRLRPHTNANGIRTVYSTYSFLQFGQGKKAMECPAGTPWTNCLNKICTVDPTDPTKADCVCDVVRTGTWMTLGGNCDTSTCKDGYWSGATMTAAEVNGNFLVNALGLKKTPAQWCPK